eukprot:c40585_g1_i1 orf=173-325(-)
MTTTISMEQCLPLPLLLNSPCSAPCTMQDGKEGGLFLLVFTQNSVIFCHA